MPLPDNPTDEQYQQLLPVVLKRIIADPSNFGAVPDDISVKLGNGKPVVASGQFTKRITIGGKATNQVYGYQLSSETDGLFLSYKAVSGVSDKPPEMNECNPMDRVSEMMTNYSQNQDWLQQFYRYAESNKTRGMEYNKALVFAEYQTDLDVWFQQQIA